jgi:hypothetical protein
VQFDSALRGLVVVTRQYALSIPGSICPAHPKRHSMHSFSVPDLVKIDEVADIDRLGPGGNQSRFCI